MVFQNYALYPYLTVAQNIAFPLKMARSRRRERERRVREVAELLGLADLLERKPAQLSGGQRQRVAMGRAIVRAPQAYLMDEPLSNLDAKLRVQMRADIADLQARLGVTTVYVTHDQSEAMTLGHRVAVLRDGRLQQCAAPRELYDRPANTFVAGFIGSPAMNLWRCRSVATGRSISPASGSRARPMPLRARRRAGSTACSSGCGPSRCGSPRTGIAARVEVVEVLGADAYVFCSATVAGAETRLATRVEAHAAPARGESVRLVAGGGAHLFDPVSGERLGSTQA